MKNNESSFGSQFKRLLFVNINKYQQKVIYPCLALCVIACIGAFYTMYYIRYVDDNLAVLCNLDAQRLTRDIPWFMSLHSFNKVVPWIFFGLSSTLLIVISWITIVSNRLLGPGVRVLKELDDILSGQRKDPIGSRPDDELFQELLKRINVLIQKTK